MILFGSTSIVNAVLMLLLELLLLALLAFWLLAYSLHQNDVTITNCIDIDYFFPYANECGRESNGMVSPHTCHTLSNIKPFRETPFYSASRRTTIHFVTKISDIEQFFFDVFIVVTLTGEFSTVDNGPQMRQLYIKYSIRYTIFYVKSQLFGLRYF